MYLLVSISWYFENKSFGYQKKGRLFLVFQELQYVLPFFYYAYSFLYEKSDSFKSSYFCCSKGFNNICKPLF